MQSGHYRMARGWQNHEAFEGDPYSKRDAWVWMIERAAWKATRHRIEGKFVPIERGQFTASMRTMADAWGWHRNRVQRFLALLASDGMIGTEAGTGKTVVTIRNYNTYQAEPSTDGTDAGTPTGQQRDTNGTLKKEGKEGKEDSEANASDGERPSSNSVKELWDRGVAILGSNQRSLLGKLRKTYTDPVVLAAIVACENEGTADPAAFLVACCERSKANGRGSGQAGAYDILANAAIEYDQRKGYRGPSETTH